MKRYYKQTFSSHGETDKKNSWYWNVLYKKYGNWEKCQQEINESRYRVDPTFSIYKH